MTEQDLLADDQNQQVDFVKELTGPGGKFDRSKYASETEMWQAVAKGKYEADRMVDFKNSEYDKLNQDYLKIREEHMSGASFKEMLDQFRQEQLASSATNQNANEVKEPVFDPKKIEELVDQRLTAAEQARRQQENFNSVRNTLRNEFGENHTQVLKQQIDELGITPEYANELAKNNPKVLLKLLGVGERRADAGFQPPPRTNSNATSFAPKGAELRDFMFYEKMRKEDPVRYRDPKTQVQMHKDAIALGLEKFNARAPDQT